ncbi:uncharacterized protein [Choristoneura fumiferana]|uniref:uncharacterized protein n=1 Tax=Choristoneura fumiferana TaxID=7141 RepID=UPI003D15D1DA
MPDPSVNYYCKVTGDGIVSGTRACHELEPHGTEVVPECNRPFYYSSSVLLNMHCVDGSWDHVAVCQPDSGTPTPIADILIISGTREARRAALARRHLRQDIHPLQTDLRRLSDLHQARHIWQVSLSL